MYIFKIIVLSIFFFAIKSNLFAQIDETIREGNIKTQIIWVTEKVKLGEKKYKKQELRFDSDGFCIEEILYNRRGKIILHKSYSYKKNLLEREIEFDSKGFILQHIEYKYVNKILVKKIVYNGQGDIIRDEQMIYEYQD